MITSDFATVGGFGYPELFQTGESYQGQQLHDHQHPHDLFSEAADAYHVRCLVGPARALWEVAILTIAIYFRYEYTYSGAASLPLFGYGNCGAGRQAVNDGPRTPQTLRIDDEVYSATIPIAATGFAPGN